MNNDAESDDEDEEDPHRLRIKETDQEEEEDADKEKPPTTSVVATVVVKTESALLNNPTSSTSEAPKSPSIRPWSNGVVHPVRPDVIFSHRRASESPSSSSSTPHHPSSESDPVAPSKSTTNPAAVISRVPSVVLGQSGGVKTMVWTGHWADQQQTSPPRARTGSSAGSSPGRGPPPSIQQRNSGISNRLTLIDNNDPTIRLSVDGLLSLAQAQSPPSRSLSINRSSPPQVIFLNFQISRFFSKI